MERIKNAYRAVLRVKNTWTYRNMQLIVIFSFGLVILWQDFGADIINLVPVVKAEYQAPCKLDCILELRAREMYRENRVIDLELYRHRAIIERKEMLLVELYNSPFVDYDEIEKLVYFSE